MDMQQIHNFAKKLVDVHGAAAEAEAASQLKAAEESGDTDKIDNWRRIRAAIRERKPAHES